MCYYVQSYYYAHTYYGLLQVKSISCLNFYTYIYCSQACRRQYKVLGRFSRNITSPV